MSRCAQCGTPLTHINEACPNCLPGLAERPPIYPQPQPIPREPEPCQSCAMYEAELTRLRDIERLAGESVAMIQTSIDAVNRVLSNEVVGVDNRRAWQNYVDEAEKLIVQLRKRLEATNAKAD